MKTIADVAEQYRIEILEHYKRNRDSIAVLSIDTAADYAKTEFLRECKVWGLSLAGAIDNLEYSREKWAKWNQ